MLPSSLDYSAQQSRKKKSTVDISLGRLSCYLAMYRIIQSLAWNDKTAKVFSLQKYNTTTSASDVVQRKEM